MASESDLNQVSTESDIEWSLRLQKALEEKIKKVRAGGNSINRILLLMPPKFIEKIYSITFACSKDESRQIIFGELKKNGYITLYGVLVISNPSILYPEVQVLGDLRQAQKESRIQSNKLFGGRVTKN